MKLKIQLHSFWATGTGKAGGSLDSIVLKDKDNLPYIPGKTLKGLLRDAYRECNLPNEKLLFEHTKGNAEDNLNNEDLAVGNLRFNSARVVESRNEIIKYNHLLYRTKTAISIDDNGQAEDYSLRKNEMTIPLTLEVDLHYKNNVNTDTKSEEHAKDIVKACKMLRLLGEKRHRGLGRCKIEFTDKNNLEQELPENSKNEVVQFKETETNSNEFVFTCLLNEPIILIHKDKTEHNIASLDYIPGSVFRGIVAGNLFGEGEIGANIDSIVFNNDVQFEDAHIIHNNARTLKLPYAFYKEKSEENKFLNFRGILDWSKKKKQQKTGYFAKNEENLECINIQYGSVIKSSRSIKNRASEKGGLFTYHYLEAGQEFIFSVKSKKPSFLEKIHEILINKQHFIGKSTSSEFGGAITIQLKTKKTSIEETIEDVTTIYAESNLCFLNDYGEFTATPSGVQLTGNTATEIDWLKSQVKTRRYAPYNGYRKNWDSERLIIEKGSVFVLKEVIKVTNSKKGLFQTEGYGNILLNPDFLMEKEPINYKRINTSSNKKIEDKEVTIFDGDTMLIKYLKENHNAFIKRKRVKEAAFNYPKSDFKQEKNSQWARVFDATTRATTIEELNNLLFTIEREQTNCSILMGGTNAWEAKDVKTFKELIKSENALTLIRRIAKNNLKKQENDVSL